MHMADALLSPAVGGTLWAASAGLIAYCSSKVRKELDDKKIPLMGVLGAFLFAAQMINFTIPGTGSSGHLGGGLLLAILLGPHAAFLTIASVLVVQALFFADGGLLALGCNIFNLGFFPAFVAYPFIYKKIVGRQPTPARITIGAIVAAVVGMQLGAFGVVLETLASGISSLPFTTFVLLMQPIHLAIGIVEGVVTAAIVLLVYRARPEILLSAQHERPIGAYPVRRVVIAFFALALVTGGIVSWFASDEPDGLEWSIGKVTGKEEIEGTADGIHGTLAALQQRFAFLPDYNFKKPPATTAEGAAADAVSGEDAPGHTAFEPQEEATSRLGTSVAGLVGGIITLALAVVIGVGSRRFSASAPAAEPE
jgi:cobalt/nickel transport system permease protein